MGRGAGHALVVVGAGRPRGGGLRHLHDAPDRSPARGRDLRSGGGARPCQLAQRGAAASMNDVTHSYEAGSGAAVREVARRRRAFPNGWWGMALLICTEATLFGT